MPIYEFYCSPCNTLLNFFSSKIDTTTVPPCPRCASALERKPARFATLSKLGSSADEGEEGFDALGIDEERFGAAFESALAEVEASGSDADDPRQMARLLRKIGDAAGLEPGPQMEEMLRRLEIGEDAESLEEEMGDAFDAEAGEDADPLADLFRRKRAALGRRRRPRRDEELYFL